jgi:uncharacterized coiled-coil protein SlyX
MAIPRNKTVLDAGTHSPDRTELEARLARCEAAIDGIEARAIAAGTGSATGQLRDRARELRERLADPAPDADEAADLDARIAELERAVDEAAAR